ncbi:MAG: OmpA family protein [Polyangiaceae bacterium]|nr:OmpA family protein [Polyangiaceae bacterium]
MSKPATADAPAWRELLACTQPGIRVTTAGMGGPRRLEVESIDGASARPRVAVTDSAVTIRDKIYFQLDSAVVDPKSYPLLDEIAAVLNEHAELELIEVAGHADSQGAAAHNVQLTRARAGAVVEQLVKRSVAQARLRSAGYGSHCAVDPAKTEEAYEKNRRVEFPIVKRSGVAIEPGWGGCEEATMRGITKPSLPASTTQTPSTPPPTTRPSATSTAVIAGGPTGEACYRYPPTRVDLAKRALPRPFGPFIGPIHSAFRFETTLQTFESTLCELPTPGLQHAYNTILFSTFYVHVSRKLPDDDPRQRQFVQRALDLAMAGNDEIATLERSPDPQMKAGLTKLAQHLRSLRYQAYFDAGLYDEWLALDAPRDEVEFWELANHYASRREEFLKALVKASALSPGDIEHAQCDIPTILASRAEYEVGDRELAARMFRSLVGNCHCRTMNGEVPRKSLELVPAEARSAANPRRP